MSIQKTYGVDIGFSYLTDDNGDVLVDDNGDFLIVLGDPSETALAISLDLVKQHLRIDETDTSQDAYLTLVIRSATTFVENFTRRTLINTVFRTFRDSFSDNMILKRSKLQEVIQVQYYKDGVLQVIDPSVYYNTKKVDYSSIYLNETQSWPSDVDSRKQSILIDFIAGYGETDAQVPYDIRMALLNIIASLYENRGDCWLSSGVNVNNLDLNSLSPNARVILERYRIFDMVYRTDTCG